MEKLLIKKNLEHERSVYQGTGGLSENNAALGFEPAFLETTTGTIYPSLTAQGAKAPFHCLDGLPNELIASRDSHGHVVTVNVALVSGFLHQGKFHTREQAALALQQTRRRRTTGHPGTVPAATATPLDPVPVLNGLRACMYPPALFQIAVYQSNCWSWRYVLLGTQLPFEILHAWSDRIFYPACDYGN